MHVQLDFVRVVLKTAQDAQRMPDLHVVLSQPLPHASLAAAALVALLVEVVEPEDAGEDACAVVQAEEVLVVFFDIKDDSAGDLYFC